MSKRLAILGGTFDPVHIGHLRIALRLKDAGFDQVLLLPNRHPPHRDSPQATPGQRLSMLELATKDLPGITVCDLELKREDLSYSYITLQEMTEIYAEYSLTWVMGTDAWLGFHRWFRCNDILELVNLLVIHRPDQKNPDASQARMPFWQREQLQQRSSNLNELLSARQGSICQLSWPGLDISASDLRRSLAAGENIRFLIPDRVLAYLQQQKLYQ